MRSRAWVLMVAAACGSRAPEPARPAPPAPAPAPVAIANRAPPGAAAGALLPWPVAPFTASQIADATGCQVEKLAKDRYPKDAAIDALATAYARKDGCDEAALAEACAERLEENAEPPTSCVDAYRAAVRVNPAFAVIGNLAGAYFGKTALVDPPPLARRAVASVVIEYQWGGLGDAVDWHLSVSALAHAPKVDASGSSAQPVKDAGEVAKRAAALGGALGNFLPIPKPLHAVRCFDNYPDWKVTLAFDDGSRLELATHGSNLLGVGWPWQIELGGITYMQLAPSFAQAIRELVHASGQPFGQPMGMTCHGYDLEGAMFGRTQ